MTLVVVCGFSKSGASEVGMYAQIRWVVEHQGDRGEGARHAASYCVWW